MRDLPIRRVLWVLLAYAVGTAVVLPGIDWLQRVLALPPQFGTLARGGMLLGVPLAIVIAWRYPELGAKEHTLLSEVVVTDDTRP